MIICAEAVEAAEDISEVLGIGKDSPAREFVAERIQQAFDKALGTDEEETL